ncbi:MAG: tRNA epoxyqueuosine(34) reductase QueG [Gemmatimonadetes bacterium]|nr:tRNA epoxyqueuosine(34) reductase QueG [Gemmatimonadota bacterium]
MSNDPADGRQILERVRERATELGFTELGVTEAGPCRDAAHLDAWLDAGRHGEMEWMARDPERRTDPRRILPGARSVISLLTCYSGPDDEPSPTPLGLVSRYARGRDYHNVLEKRLRKLVRFLEELSPEHRTRTAVDHRPILEKEWAERAGLGWIGKHTNLISRGRGSWFFLSELITEIPLPASTEPAAEHCGKCTACLDACPTGAIVAPWQVDARLCISYLTIELRGPIPRDLRAQVGEWIFGCDICQDVCPWNRFATPVDDPSFSPDEGRWRGDATEFLNLTEEAFRERFRGSPVKRAGRDGFLRNVCVALGNRRDPAETGALRGALEDQAALVRGHAAWALGRIGTEEARAALRARDAVETEPDVREEIRLALEG